MRTKQAKPEGRTEPLFIGGAGVRLQERECQTRDHDRVSNPRLTGDREKRATDPGFSTLSQRTQHKPGARGRKWAKTKATCDSDRHSAAPTRQLGESRWNFGVSVNGNR
jgi:hypothetical protein